MTIATFIIFIIVLAVLIIVHEFGHFIFARWFGIRVDAFKIGFGPKLIAWKRKGTEYGINAIPFGGFVKIYGENPDDESTSGFDSAKSFVNKSRWKQAMVLVAGVLFNFIFAYLIFIIIFSIGVVVSQDRFPAYSQYYSNPRIMINDVKKGSPAEKAGLKENDIVRYIETTSMNALRGKSGQSLAGLSDSQSIEDVKNVVNESHGVPIAIEYERDGVLQVIGVAPEEGIVPGKYAIGIAMDKVVDMRLPIWTALVVGIEHTSVVIKDTVLGLGTFIFNIVRGHPDFSDVAGPVRIMFIVGDSARMGFTYLLTITAIISVNLGVVNLIPFPALDGGRIIFVAIESVIRRRISATFTNVWNGIGFVLLMLLMVVVTWKDIIGQIWK